MSNIEEDIKIIENYLKDSSYKEKDNNFFKGSGWEVVDLEIPQAMANVLVEFKKDKKRIKELEEYICIAPNLDKMTATKYLNIQEDAYIRGRAEEQQRAEEIINKNYIPVQKVKEILDKAEVMDYYTLPNVIEDLEKLLEDK